MNLDYLDFEQPIAELQAKIEELRRVGNDQDINLSDEINKLETKRDSLMRSVYASLSASQVVQMARHPLRPFTRDYIDRIFTEFDELEGDRHYAKAQAILGGMARLDGKPVMVIGHQKGRTTKENVERNFSMANPEGFRKALRLMKMAERFQMPVITFIDTKGAYPGIGAEERNQSEAIARNLLEMSKLKTPIICVVIGEGCSGGALAIGVGDRVLMLQYAYYSVISPEGCASILWRSAERASDAAEALGLTAHRLYELGLIDEVIAEPAGGAHRDADMMAMTIKKSITDQLNVLETLSLEDLLEDRYQKLTAVGK
jgi:acetyl-CoA carboxylase carboxyl transferase subunit alpha